MNAERREPPGVWCTGFNSIFSVEPISARDVVVYGLCAVPLAVQLKRSGASRPVFGYETSNESGATQAAR